jgi:hypothetical protein
MQMMAETVSLHARYHLALMPVLPQSRQHEASRVYELFARPYGAIGLRSLGCFQAAGGRAPAAVARAIAPIRRPTDQSDWTRINAAIRSRSQRCPKSSRLRSCQ